MGHVAKNCPCVILLSVVSKIFENPENFKLIYRLMKCAQFSDSQYGVRLSNSKAAVDKIARAFNVFGVALDILKTFDMI